MTRQHGAARPVRRKPAVRLGFEVLESRQLLSADLDGLTALLAVDGHPAGCWCPSCGGELPAVLASGAEAVAATDAAAGPSAALVPLSGLPALNSLPGARATLYLDFDGHYEAQWGAYSNITTPAFDQDGDPTTFSSAELAAIEQIWRYVAEDYAPFNINVTTVPPASFADGVALRVAIGGTGAWAGGGLGGLSYINSFTNSIGNTAYVFAKNLSSSVRYTADAIAHEAGHAFGLEHQSEYSGTTRIAEYNDGPGDGRAPLMGISYSASRSLWWYGPTTSATTYQDDMAVIARPANGFGYRPDDHGNTAATATPLMIVSGRVSGSGVITTTADVDYFSFTTAAGSVSLTVSVPASLNNLDARLELRSAAGALLVSADPATSFGATLTATVPAGTYYLVVASHGGYGDVGQYTVSGTVAATGSVAAPVGLTAITSVGRVDLTWQDSADNETGYRVERSTDGVSWTVIANLPANSTTYTDAGVSAGMTYHYRVAVLYPTLSVGYSSVVLVTLVPAAPAGLAATEVTSTSINLVWGNVAGETGYRVERSQDGINWVQVALTGPDVAGYADTGLNAGMTYYYRVRAVNAGGDSAPSAIAGVTTVAVPAVPAAPSGLLAVAITGRHVRLRWQDNASNETGFVIQRSSTNGRSWTTIGQVGANVQVFSDTTVSRRRTYSYRVYAFNSAGRSVFSNPARVTTPSASRVRRPRQPSRAALPGNAELTSQLSNVQGAQAVSLNDSASLVDRVFIRWASRRRHD